MKNKDDVVDTAVFEFRFNFFELSDCLSAEGAAEMSQKDQENFRVGGELF